MAYPTYSDESQPGSSAPSQRARATAFAAAAAVAVVVGSLAFMAGNALADDPNPVPTVTPAATQTGSNENPVNWTTCEEAGFQGGILLGGASVKVDDDDGNGNIADVSDDKKTLTVTVAAGWVVSGIIVKGGPGLSYYTGPFPGPIVLTGMQAPLVGNPPKNVPDISHYLVCGFQDPTTPSPDPSDSPSPDPSDSPSPEPSDSPSPEPSDSPSPEPSDSPSPEPSDSPSPDPSQSSPVPSTSTTPSLPQTGSSLTGLIAVGLGLVAGGATLLLLRRRRALTE